MTRGFGPNQRGTVWVVSLQLLDELKMGTTLQRRDGPGVDGEVMAKVDALTKVAATP